MDDDFEYAGFWVRSGAAIIDTVLLMIVSYPVLFLFYGWGFLSSEATVLGPVDFLVTWVFPAVAVVWFWSKKQATPGKSALSLRVLDADTGESLSVKQSIGRYFAYFISVIPLGLGIIWVGIDRRKQGWHDKLAHTVVVRSKNRSPEPVRFPNA